MSEVLYVDCFQSLVSMSKGKLVDIKFDTSEPIFNKSPDVTYFKRVYINNSTLPQKTDVKYTIEKESENRATISSRFASENCDEKKDSFSDKFHVDISSEITTSLDALGLAEMSVKVGSNLGTAIEKATKKASKACETNEKRKQDETAKKEVRTYQISNDLTVPPRSAVTVTALGTPAVGDITYTLVYELKPANKEVADILAKGLEKFKYGDEIEKTANNTVRLYL